MRKLIIATTTFVALAAGSAVAADMPVKGPPAARSACAQFGGVYLGGHGGWTYYNSDWKDLDNYGFNFTGQDHAGDGSSSVNSWHAGAQLGYNWQRNCTVFGFQVDWSWTDAEADASYADSPLATAGRLHASNKVQWFGTARLRTGVVVDNLLLYVTGGAAFANFERNFTYTNAGATATSTFSSEDTRFGFVVGVGTEWAITNNWSLTSEVLYMGFEKDDQSFACPTTATCAGLAVGTPFRFEFSDSVWAGRVALNYRWGGR